MGLEESLSQISTNLRDGDFSVSIKFNRLERQFDDKDRMLILHSDVDYRTENFVWKSTVPTVKIPYRDPSLGFLVDGSIFSSVGVYSRAPGIVPDVEHRTVKKRIVEEPKIDIVSTRNSTFSIGYRHNAVHIIFKRRGKHYDVPMGIFLKAFSGLPYEVILSRFAYKPQALLNSFPCRIPTGRETLSRVETFGIESNEEPSIDECVNMVYNALTQTRDDTNQSRYTTHWKVTRINTYLNNLHFKTRQKYEATLSVGHRAIGTYLDAPIKIPYFKRDVITEERMTLTGKTTVERVVETVETFELPKGHFITSEDAREIRRFDIDKIRVRTSRSFILQEDSPMFFRAKGYKLIDAIPEIGAKAGDIIDDALLAKINDTNMCYLEVYTPNGRKTMHRSSDNVELGDFYSVLNYLFTHIYMQKTDVTQYEVSNRVILDYNKRVVMEVEQTYSDIASSIMGSTELRNLCDAMPNLPSDGLLRYLGDRGHKEVAQSDLTNVMSRAITESKASALMKETPGAMMSVQKGQYGRLDSFHAPDSDKVGSVQQMTVLARIGAETGEIEAPYERVRNGVPTGEIEYITAAKENNKFIVAWDCELDTPTVLARHNDDITTVPREKVDYRDPSPFCDMSISRMTIPFPGFSQPKRALMATKMNGQAIPILFPERPLVSTGADTEVPSLYFTGRDIVESSNIIPVEGKQLELVGCDWKKNMVVYKFIFNDEVFSFSVPFTATDKESLYNYNLNRNYGSKLYGLDDIVFYSQSCDIGTYEFWTRIKQGSVPLIKDYTKPSMALGVNLLVCFKTYGSSTVDDASLISARLVEDNTLSSIQIMKYDYSLRQGEWYSDTDWCPPLHSRVFTKQPVIRVTREHPTKGSTEREVLCKQEGEIVYASKNDKTGKAEVWVSTLHYAEVGDKTAGRFGDKSVIAKIVPEWMMPYDPETGETMDVVLSPLSMPSRMNYGRVLEVALGSVMAKQHRISVCTPFYPNIKKDIVDLYESEGMAPKRLFNPVYGKYTERPVMVGMLYIMKLEQMSNLKISAVGYPTAIDPVFGQPVESINQNKGQAVGEMESWALMASGAHNILDTLHSIYSDDEEARKQYFDALSTAEDNANDPWNEAPLEHSKHSTNKNALVTQTVMRMFGCDIEVKDNRFVISPLNMEDIEIEITKEEFSNGYEVVKDFEWVKVRLTAPVINPFWIYCFPLHLLLGVKSIKTLANCKAYLDLNKLVTDRANCVIPAKSVTEVEDMTVITGIEAVIKLINSTTVEEALTRLRIAYDSQSKADRLNSEGKLVDSDDTDGNVDTTTFIGDDQEALEDWSMLGSLADVPMNVADVMRFLNEMRKSGRELTDLIWYEMPIMPRIFRQSNIVGNREHQHSFQQQLKSICNSRSTSQGEFDALKNLLGFGNDNKDNLVSIRGYFFGHESESGQHGKVRSAVLSKRVGFSGRVVIVPMADPEISPFFVGLPWRVVCVELGKILGMRLKNRDDEIARDISDKTGIPTVAITALEANDWQATVESLGEFNPYVLSKYFTSAGEDDLYFIYHYIRSVVKRLVEGNVRSDGMVLYNGEWVDPATLPDDATIDCAVAMSGRQPTLHKKSIRGYFVKLVDGYCMHIHPIVCSGYNADFDGDTMWHIQLLGRDKIEACRTLSVMQDLISEKDGSYTLDLVQDVALGIYCATTFKDNAEHFSAGLGEYYYFDDLAELRTQLEYGDLHYYDAVVFYNKETGYYYCSTAGRVLVNGVLPDAFTRLPFTDKEGIAQCVLGNSGNELFKELLHDTVWTTTSIRPYARPEAVKLDSLLLDAYNLIGARGSILVAQQLYEIGLTASDVYSVSMTLDDMSSTVDKEQYMQTPRDTVEKLNSLYRLGLISEESRKLSAINAWGEAKDLAQKDIIQSLDPNSNTYYMMYSGARGKPDQVMQSIGFIGSIQKTAVTDIEYPILHGYGEGLSSFDLMQTRPTARIGVISTQAGTKDTGYSTRQSVYMTSGLGIKGDDCDINMNLVEVRYDYDKTVAVYSDGSVGELEALIKKVIAPDTEGFDILRPVLIRTGYVITEEVLQAIIDNGINSLKTVDDTIAIGYTVSDSWRKFMVDSYYSYALPYTDGMKITEKTVDWIEENGLKDIIAFTDWGIEEVPLTRIHPDTGEVISAGHTLACFEKEAYLPVEYDYTQYSISMNGQELASEALYPLRVLEDSSGFKYYKYLLADGCLTEKAIRYLTTKKIRSIRFENNMEATISYKLSSLFRDVVLGRSSAGLLHLDGDSCITLETIKSIEELQLDYIPVRTGLTCLSKGGICSKCYGKSLSSKIFLKDGDNLGIAASQTMCEPLSQGTLNVAHSGGKRNAGTGLISGLDYYKRMIQGSMTTDRNKSLKEGFSLISGYVKQNPHNKNYIQITGEDGSSQSIDIGDADRLIVPNGAYVDADDTIQAGFPDLRRYDSTNIFNAAIRIRYLLIKEYHKIFEDLNVSARNTEVLSRAQTSICYLVGNGATAKLKDTGEECRNPTGQYMLRVSSQNQVVNWFTGIAGYAFEDVASMLLMGLFTTDGLALNSCLGNLITGTKVGSTKAQFIPKRRAPGHTKYHKSHVKEQIQLLEGMQRVGDRTSIMMLGSGQNSANYLPENEDEILSKLFEGENSMRALPDMQEEIPAKVEDIFGHQSISPFLDINGSEIPPLDIELVTEEESVEETTQPIIEVELVSEEVEDEDTVNRATTESEFKETKGTGTQRMNLH